MYKLLIALCHRVFSATQSLPASGSPPPASKAGGKAAPPLRAEDLDSFWLIEEFLKALDLILASSPVAAPASLEHPNRELKLNHYLGLFLLGLINPVISTLRGLARASLLNKVQKNICQRPVALASLSEMQHLVDPVVLEKVLDSLVSRLPADSAPKTRSKTGTGTGAPEKEKENIRWLVQDGSLIAALPRMAWALYGGGRAGFPNRAVRLHLSFDLETQAPADQNITPGRNCERAEWEKMLLPGAGYIGDRYYSESHALLTRLQWGGTPFIVRLRDIVLIEYLHEHPLPEDAADERVLRDSQVRLGGQKALSTPLRLIEVRSQSGEIILLVTNLSPGELSAADAALLYRRRWEVEYYFRWVKCVLRGGNAHWLAESARGAAVQVLLTLIAGVLLQLRLGKRPTRRMIEAVQLCLMGMATPEEAALLIERERQSQAAKGRKIRKRITL